MKREPNMKNSLCALIITGLLTSIATANTNVNIQTSLGPIEIELYDDEAPLSTQNFLTYAKNGFYQGTVFHRVIPNFMIQGGGFDKNLNQKKANAPIKNEASNGLKNVRGSIAMARTNEPDSATSQFFINTVDNQPLNKSGSDAGYAVFGTVIKGMDIVDRISKVQTTERGMHQNVPVENIVIEKVQILNKINNNKNQ